jgi:hypothetical protein
MPLSRRRPAPAACENHSNVRYDCLAGAVMSQSKCDRCNETGSAHDFISARSDGTWQMLCSRCFNIEMARFADLQHFQHPSFTPLRLRDTHGLDHEFHFRSLVLGNRLSLEAFEVTGNGDCAGYRFQSLGEPEFEPVALFGQLIEKIKRALATTYLVTDAGRLQLAETRVTGRIEWDRVDNANRPCVIIDGRRIGWADFGAMLLAFEGWQFRFEMFDPSDEA